MNKSYENFDFLIGIIYFYLVNNGRKRGTSDTEAADQRHRRNRRVTYFER